LYRERVRHEALIGQRIPVGIRQYWKVTPNQSNESLVDSLNFPGITHDIEERAVERDRQSPYDIRLGRFDYPRKNRGFRLIIEPVKQAAELRPVHQQGE
jgi:hypothetical protein